MLHTVATMPAWVGARLRKDSLTERTMLEPSAQEGVELGAASQEMHAAPCPAEVAPLLGLSPRDPAFVIERLVSDRQNRPVQHLVATFRWDSFSYNPH